MQCPFPGMDPYLEDSRFWPEFHLLLVGLLDQLMTIEARSRKRYDVLISRDYHIEVREEADGMLVTLLDIITPDAKTTDAGRNAYLEIHREAIDRLASIVEVDLLLQGRPMLDYSREGLPPWQYAVTITRSNQPERYEIYTSTLKKRLPRFRVPLLANDRDAVLDLQAPFMRAYELGGFAGRIDYQSDPPVALTPEDQHWLDETLSAGNLRVPHMMVARAAYFNWEAEGRPHGRDKEHWQQALTQLQGK